MMLENYVKTITLVLSFLLLASIGGKVFADNPPIPIFTQSGPEYPGDTRHIYGNKVFKLILDATINEFGEYKMETAPSMNMARSIKSVSKNRYKNFFFATTYDATLESDTNLEYIKFPIVQGLLGYRVCFCPESRSKKIDESVREGEFSTLTHGQGKEWTDVTVLKHNGLDVTEVESHNSLFNMVAAGRFDLFCRGSNEIFEEYNQFSHINGIDFNRTFVMQYDLPVFFYANKKNKAAISRITKGLIQAHENGSLTQLLHQHFGESLAFVALEGRKFFYLENPYTKELDPSYKKYYLHPHANKLNHPSH